MFGLSRMTQIVEPSSIRRMFNIAENMHDVVSFALGEPDFKTPENIVETAVKYMRQGYNKYTANAGLFALREAVAQKQMEEQGVVYDPAKEVIITAGAMGALSLLFMVTLDPDDEVIISNPYWTNYLQQIRMFRGIPKFVDVFEEDGFVFTGENLKNAVTGKTKAIVLNSPANPTGGVIPLNTLKQIAKVAQEHDLLIVFDEVYKKIIYEDFHQSIAKIPGMKEQTVVIDSFSKSYAMTGWRVGYAAGPEKIIAQMVKYQENVTASVNTAAQYAAIEALSGNQDRLAMMVNTYAKRRRLAVDGIRNIEGLTCIEPKGAFYIFANIKKTGMSSEEFAMKLLQQERVVVIPGNGFGKAGEGFVRISYATSEAMIEEGLKRIGRFLTKIR